MDLGVATQPTYLRDTPVPGDKITFGDFDLEFIVDEDFENYLEIHNWIRGLLDIKRCWRISEIYEKKTRRIWN